MLGRLKQSKTQKLLFSAVLLRTGYHAHCLFLAFIDMWLCVVWLQISRNIVVNASVDQTSALAVNVMVFADPRMAVAAHLVTRARYRLIFVYLFTL